LKEDTHIIFGAGLSALAASLLGCSLTCIALAAMANLVIHPLIDRLGHEKHWWQKHPRRHKATHSLLGATLVSLAVAAALRHAAPAAGVGEWQPLALAALIGGLSHLALDALNPSGVYLCGRRVSLRAARYNSLWANLLFQSLGIILLVLAAARAGG